MKKLTKDEHLILDQEIERLLDIIGFFVEHKISEKVKDILDDDCGLENISDSVYKSIRKIKLSKDDSLRKTLKERDVKIERMICILNWMKEGHLHSESVGKSLDYILPIIEHINDELEDLGMQEAGL